MAVPDQVLPVLCSGRQFFRSIAFRKSFLFRGFVFPEVSPDEKTFRTSAVFIFSVVGVTVFESNIFVFNTSLCAFSSNCLAFLASTDSKDPTLPLLLIVVAYWLGVFSNCISGLIYLSSHLQLNNTFQTS